MERIRAYFDAAAVHIDYWRRRNRYYRQDQARYLEYLVGPGKKILEIGSGNGDLLNRLEPSHGTGIDVSPEMVRLATRKYPHLTFRTGDESDLDQFAHETFDVIILSDLVGYLDDIHGCLQRVRRLCAPHTRLVISYYNFLWQPILRLGEKLRLKMPTPEQSWLSLDDLANVIELADFQLIKTERRLLFPVYVPLLSAMLNRIGSLPVINKACLNHYVVARPVAQPAAHDLSVSVVIPCRNERGNIAEAVARIPSFAKDLEIIFVDGHSSDGTPEEIRRIIDAHPGRDIKLLTQSGQGKGDAVRLGFDNARGDVLIILDADLTVSPEDLPKFYDAIARGRAELLNGCRLIYPMEDQAMRTLNLLGNKFFALAFSWLLGQRLKDTLCGTKALLRDDYRMLAANREFFGDFDPFGDFDLLFGASKLNLKIAEIPVRYHNRTYGETKIHRFRHGWLLLRMVLYAYRRLKSV